MTEEEERREMGASAHTKRRNKRNKTRMKREISARAVRIYQLRHSAHKKNIFNTHSANRFSAVETHLRQKRRQQQQTPHTHTPSIDINHFPFVSNKYHRMSRFNCVGKNNATAVAASHTKSAQNHRSVTHSISGWLKFLIYLMASK